jgi:hypothetical protein
MKRWAWTVLFATSAQFSFVACNYEVRDVTTDGGGGNAGNGNANSASSGGVTSSSSSSGGVTSSSSSSSGNGMLGPNQCRTADDCATGMGQFCLSPDEPPPCGTCYQPILPCENDDQCLNQGVSMICERAPCGCSAECRTGCMGDAECPAGESCGAGGRCLPKTCSSAANCPTNFDCSNNQCMRRTCANDAVCDGYCVKERCYETPGACTLPVP